MEIIVAAILAWLIFDLGFLAGVLWAARPEPTNRRERA